MLFEDIDVVPVAAHIVLHKPEGKALFCEAGKWGWVEDGIFGHGEWADERMRENEHGIWQRNPDVQTRDILIPYDGWHHIEYELKAAVEAKARAEAHQEASHFADGIQTLMEEPKGAQLN